jgi:hypothetical protein
MKLVEKIETHISFSKYIFPENRAVYDIMWKNMVLADRPWMTM